MAAAARTNLGDRFDTEVLGRDLEETYLSALGDRVPAPSLAQLAPIA